MPGRDQAEYQKEYLHHFLDNRVQRIGQDVLERYPAFRHRCNDATEPGLG